MKNLILIITICLFSFQDLLGQQIPLYSQYNVNPFLYNPARTGQSGHTEAHLIYRKQWDDFAGAPETRALTFEGMLQNKSAGFGLYVYSDATDILERLGAYLSYAYYLDFNDHRISLGLNAGVQDLRVDFDRVVVDDPNELPLLSGNLRRGVGFDASAGINYQFRNFQLGFSVPQLLQTELNYLNTGDPTFYQLSRHYLAQTSYNIPVIEDKFFIEPNVMFRTDASMLFQVDAGAVFRYKDMAWLGATYRYDYAVTLGGGLRVHDRVSVGYAYDLSINELSGYSGGSHEVLVGIRFGKRDDSGLIESIQRIEQRQVTQTERIESIEQDTEQLKEESQQQKEQIERQQEEIDQLKQELQDALDQFEERLIERIREGEIQPQRSGRGYDSRGRPLPDNLIEEVDWEDIEFIYGKSPEEPYFMIVASLKTATQAKNHADRLKRQGHEVGVVYNIERDWYYVFLETPADIDAGLEKLYQLRSEDPDNFGDAWIHIYR